MAPGPEPFHLVDFWLSISWPLIWKILIALLLLKNFKNIPFAWHVRIEIQKSGEKDVPNFLVETDVSIDPSAPWIPLVTQIK